MDVGDLRLLIEGLSDETKIFFKEINGHYDVEMWYVSDKEISHKGKEYTNTGIFIEVD